MQSALQQAQAQQTLQQKLQQAKAQGATDEQIRQMQAEADASRAGRAKRFGIMAMLLGLMTVLFPLGTVGMFVLMATMSVGYIAPERLPVIWHDWVLPWAPAHFVVDGVRSIVFLGDGVFNANALWVAVCVVIGVIVAAVGIALPARKKAGDDKVAQGDVVATAATTTNATHSIITTTLQLVETTHLRSEPAAAARHPLHRRLRPIRQSGRAILHLRRLHLRPIRLLPQRTRTRCHDPRPAAGQRLQRRQRHRRREQVAVRQRPGMTHPITKNRTKRKGHVPIRSGTRIPARLAVARTVALAIVLVCAHFHAIRYIVTVTPFIVLSDSATIAVLAWYVASRVRERFGALQGRVVDCRMVASNVCELRVRVPGIGRRWGIGE